MSLRIPDLPLQSTSDDHPQVLDYFRRKFVICHRLLISDDHLRVPDRQIEIHSNHQSSRKVDFALAKSQTLRYGLNFRRSLEKGIKCGYVLFNDPLQSLSESRVLY